MTLTEMEVRILDEMVRRKRPLSFKLIVDLVAGSNRDKRIEAENAINTLFDSSRIEQHTKFSEPTFTITVKGFQDWDNAIPF